MRLVITVRVILAEPASLGSGPVVEVRLGRLGESRGRRVSEPLIQCVQLVVQPAGQLTGRDRADGQAGLLSRSQAISSKLSIPATVRIQRQDLIVRPTYDILREPGQADAGTRM